MNPRVVKVNADDSEPASVTCDCCEGNPTFLADGEQRLKAPAEDRVPFASPCWVTD